MQAIVRTVAGRVNGDNTRPISQNKTARTKSLVVSLNILLRQFAKTDEQRYALASDLAGRPIKSTYDLTESEVIAILRVAYPDGNRTSVNQTFCTYAWKFMETNYYD